jgi:ABC transport system ATP-binding/permease protein
MPQLVIVDPHGAEQRVELSRQEYFLGRDPTCHVQLPDKKVSRKHARIFLKAGTYWVEDLGSANGVLHNGRPVSGPLRLIPNMRLEIGGFHLSWEPDPAPQPVGGEAFSLLGRTPPFLDQTFMLPTGHLDIGRVEGNAITIPDASVSRKHARIEVSADAVSVEDLESANGTFVNGLRVGRRSLTPGDRVHFGSVEFEFLRAGQVAGIGGAGRLWNRFLHLDRPIQIAAIIGVMTLVLLVVTLAVTLGRGPRPSRPTGVSQSPEAAYEQAIADGQKSARELMARQAWPEATQTFQRVLDKDPIDREARRGLAEAQSNQRDQQALAAARSSLDTDQPLEAIRRLQSIPAGSHYGAAAQELLARARVVAGDAWLDKARAACKRGEWKECHDRAVSLLEVQPDSVTGQALVNESENAMRARKISYTPWALPASGAGAPSLDKTYTDPDVREAALRYSAGDLDTAVRRAQLARGPNAQRLLSSLTEFRRAKAIADDAAAAGDNEHARKAWEAALVADAKLLPPTHASAPREEIKRRLSLELYRKGDAAFGRANYVEAYQAWNSGLHFNPSSPELLAGIGKLEGFAQGLLNALPASGSYTPEQCDRLQDVISMTRGDSLVYQDASRKKQTGCR